MDNFNIRTYGKNELDIKKPLADSLQGAFIICTLSFSIACNAPGAYNATQK